MGTPAAVKILIGGSVFLSYPLQFYVVEIMKPAALIPNIGLFISLIGAVASSTLAIIFPCIMEIVTFWPNMGKYNLTLVKCILITLLGLLGFITGSVTSIQSIIVLFENGKDSHSVKKRRVTSSEAEVPMY